MMSTQERSVIHSTFVLERHYPAPPERVFRAFSDTAKKSRWMVESHGHQLEHYEMDFRVGGEEHARFRFKKGSPVGGMICRNDGYYQDIVPNRRVVESYTMTIGDRRISASLVTVEILPVENGADLVLTHQAAFFEGSDGPELREEGWRGLLDHLAREL